MSEPMVDGVDPVPPQPEPDATEVLCCFLIVVPKEGGSQAVLDTNARFSAQREATPADIYPAVANILADFQAVKSAEAVMSFQMQMAQQAQAQAQAAAILAQTQGGKAPWLPTGVPNQRHR